MKGLSPASPLFLGFLWLDQAERPGIALPLKNNKKRKIEKKCPSKKLLISEEDFSILNFSLLLAACSRIILSSAKMDSNYMSH